MAGNPVVSIVRMKPDQLLLLACIVATGIAILNGMLPKAQAWAGIISTNMHITVCWGFV